MTVQSSKISNFDTIFTHSQTLKNYSKQPNQNPEYNFESQNVNYQ